MKTKKIYINNLYLTSLVMLIFILGITGIILSKPEFKWYEIIILPIGVAAIIWAIVIEYNQRIIIDRNNNLIIFKFGFSKSEKYKRSLELIKEIKVYIENFTVCFFINYGEYSETIKHHLTTRGVTLIKRRVKKIDKILRKEINNEK